MIFKKVVIRKNIIVSLSIIVFFSLFILNLNIYSQTIQTQIIIDQFGYREDAPIKEVTFADPQSGQNSSRSYDPTAGGNYFYIVRSNDSSVRYSNLIVQWSPVAHVPSHDICWYGVFSDFNESFK